MNFRHQAFGSVKWAANVCISNLMLYTKNPISLLFFDLHSSLADTLLGLRSCFEVIPHETAVASQFLHFFGGCGKFFLNKIQIAQQKNEWFAKFKCSVGIVCVMS